MARKATVSKDPAYYESKPIPQDSQARFDLLVEMVNNIVAANPGYLGEITAGERVFWQDIFAKITHEQWVAISLMSPQFRRTVIFFLTAISGEVGFDGVYRIMLGPFFKEMKDRYEARFDEIAQDAENRVITARNECADAIMAKDAELKSAVDNARFWHQHHNWMQEERDEARTRINEVMKEADERVAAADLAAVQATASESQIRGDLLTAENQISDLMAKAARYQAIAFDRLLRETEERTRRLQAEKDLAGARQAFDLMTGNIVATKEKEKVDAAEA